jgi:hypothetical protein
MSIPPTDNSDNTSEGTEAVITDTSQNNIDVNNVMNTDTLTTTNINSITTTNTWGDIFNDHTAGKWKCDGCAMYNEDEFEACLSCQKENPHNEPNALNAATTTTNTWGDTFNNLTAGKWKCSDCTSYNEDIFETCQICQKE